MTMSLRRNLARSRYGCQTGGPRRVWSLAFQFLMQPLMNGASARSRRVCNRMANAFMGKRERKSEGPGPKKAEVRRPKAEAHRAGGEQRWTARGARPAAAFGLRASGIRPSFGLRASGFGLSFVIAQRSA